MGLVDLAGGILTAVITFVVLLRISFIMTLIAFGFLAVFGIGLRKAFKTIRPIFRERAKINAEVRKIFADPEIQKNFLERQYFESIAGTPEQLTKYIKADEPKWRKLIHDAKVKGE